MREKTVRGLELVASTRGGRQRASWFVASFPVLAKKKSHRCRCREGRCPDPSAPRSQRPMLPLCHPLSCWSSHKVERVVTWWFRFPLFGGSKSQGNSLVALMHETGRLGWVTPSACNQLPCVSTTLVPCRLLPLLPFRRGSPAGSVSVQRWLSSAKTNGHSVTVLRLLKPPDAAYLAAAAANAGQFDASHSAAA